VAPVSAVTAVHVLDHSGAQTLLDPAVYHLEKDSQRPQLLAKGTALPSVPAGGSAEIQFRAGYGPNWVDLPVDLAQAVFLLAAHYYENRRGEGSRDALLPFGVMALIEAYRSVRLLGSGL